MGFTNVQSRHLCQRANRVTHVVVCITVLGGIAWIVVARTEGVSKGGLSAFSELGIDVSELRVVIIPSDRPLHISCKLSTTDIQALTLGYRELADKPADKSMSCSKIDQFAVLVECLVTNTVGNEPGSRVQSVGSTQIVECRF